MSEIIKILMDRDGLTYDLCLEPDYIFDFI